MTLLLLSLLACDKTDPLDTASTGDDTGVVDADGDGVGAGEDCDDQDAAVFPGAEEACDGLDNDCDSATDEGLLLSFYADSDADGFGDPGQALQECEAPSGYVEDDQDCADDDAQIYPGATEVCDGVDNNCDNEIDEGLLQTFYKDKDSDGYGDPTDPVQACEASDVAVSDNTDCDDNDPQSYPGAEEVVADGIDQDCNGTDATEELSGTLDLWDGSSYGTTSAGQCFLLQVELSRPQTLTHIGAAVQVNSTSDLFDLAVYTDDGANNPQDLLAVITDTALVTGENELALDSPISVSAGKLWVGICNEATYANGISRTGSRVAIQNGTSTAPDPFGSSGQDFSVTPINWVVGY